MEEIIYSHNNNSTISCYSMDFSGNSKQNAHSGRNVMPRCLSEGVDIFLKSVERQGGANRTFATGSSCHGWQLEPCPYGLEPLLTFRQKIPTGRPHIEEGCSVRRGRSWGVRQPYVTSHANSKRKQRLVSKLPDRCFCFDFAWLVTFNLV